MDTSIFTPTIDFDTVATEVTNNTQINVKERNDAINLQIQNL